jgi:hypothetical protein
MIRMNPGVPEADQEHIAAMVVGHVFRPTPTVAVDAGWISKQVDRELRYINKLRVGLLHVRPGGRNHPSEITSESAFLDAFALGTVALGKLAMLLMPPTSLNRPVRPGCERGYAAGS